MVDSDIQAEQAFKQLIRNRGTIKQKLTILEKFINTIKISTPDRKPSLNDVELRSKNGSSLLQEFDSIQSMIESLCEERDLDSQFKEREEFQEKYYITQDFLSQYISNCKSGVDNNSNTAEPISQSILTAPTSNLHSNSDALHNILLPKLKLPTFSGNFEHWLSFKQNFSSTIASNESLTDLQKFQFLKVSLEGYASRFVEGLEGIDKPYERAWQILCDKFDKRQFLLDTHFQQLLRIQQVSKESFYHFSQILDQITKHLTAIEGMKLSPEILYDSLVIYLISNKLDKTSLREWKELEYKSELPTLEELLEFIKNKVDLLQSLEQSYVSKPNQSVNSNYGKPLHKTSYQNHSQMNFSLNSSENLTIKCNFCAKNHSIYKCQEFLALSVLERIDNVKRLNLCQNCLRTGHTYDKCFLAPCRVCKTHNKVFKHNSLLHIDNKRVEKTESDHQTNVNMLVRPTFNGQPQVMLSTILCKVQDSKGNFHQCRALLDCGAQSNLITERFCNKLNLPCTSTNLSIIGINQVVSHLNKKCTLNLFSNLSNFKCTISCFVSPIITSNIPSYSVNVNHFNIPKDIPLADPDFYISKEIDLLIGASIFWDLILEGKIKLGDNFPTLQNTQFGYIIAGTIPVDINNISICNLSKVYIPEDEQLKQFWEINEINYPITMSKDDLQCEELFLKNTTRNSNGQFIVKFPLKHSPTLLGDSKETAIQRFLTLEKRFNSNINFYNFYKEFISEYIQLGHMTKVPNHSLSTSNYFLPHHGILKESSITTKLRVVFDGSCPSKSGWSLNDLQYVGPKVQNNIFDILVRFRIYKYVVSADISKMYRCILMHQDYRPLQQILWRENSNQDFSVYQLNTVSYGTSSAPYLAIRCLRELANKNYDQFPQACQTILNDFYVDDLLTGSDNLTELNSRCKQIYSILESGHFILRKWVSNDPKAISNLHHSDIPNSTLNIGNNESCKTLGIQWVTNTDKLKYNINQFSTTTITKRYILATISQIYDPLGLLSPVIITSKIMIQHLWSLHIPWDETIPSELEKHFLQFQTSLLNLNQLTISRNVIPREYDLLDIHCFCDASKDAYAAAVYLRSENAYNQFEIHLLCSKSKVAPLKTITIPKLELCACLLGAQLVDSVKTSLSVSVPIYMWSDSQIALSWIKTEPSLLQVFVSNRVSKIQSLTSIEDWRYVHTSDNPADLATRGVVPEKLFKSTSWWVGPTFLKDQISDWPSPTNFINPSQLPELKRKATILQITVTYSDLFTRFSSLPKLKRVTALCIRFFNNLKRKKNKRDLQVGPITVSEIDNATYVLIKLVQFELFNSELDLLRKTSILDKKHKLSSLTPFIDNKGIIRVGGRLKNTHLPYDRKHPILLHSHHPFTKLIFEDKHKKLLHPGPQLLLASVRQFYWPVGGRNLAKRIVRNCMTCFRFNPVTSTCPMGSLPENRIKPNLPFQITGLDYAGPFSILNKSGRGAILTKCYLAVFICFCTKAVHLEIVTSLMTENFLACLRRFTSRRGLPSMIYSDNGTTFVGANNELKGLGQFLNKNQDSIVDSTSLEKIRWVFIPPYTPNFGGLWEAAVKSTKHHLKRVLINRNVTYEELNTIVIQVEGILNSRPLFSLSDDPNDNATYTFPFPSRSFLTISS